jgi:hypothetical protein
MKPCSKGEICVTANFSGLWHIPFIDKRTKRYCLSPGSSIDDFMQVVAVDLGPEFEPILPFCNPVVSGRMITPYERKGFVLEDKQWVSFVFGPDGG